MSVLTKIKGWFKNMIWMNKAEQEFGVKIANEDSTAQFINDCVNAYQGFPYWADDDIRTINVAQTICAEAARLTTLNIAVNITGSARANYLQEQIEKLMPELRHWVEFGCANGEIIIKPNGYSVDIVLPNQYVVTEEIGNDITGIIFTDSYYNPYNELFYTRLEYHRIIDGKYLISNRTYAGKSKNDFSKRVNIKDTRWKALNDEITAQNTNKMLFGLFRLPMANNRDMGKTGALPLFAGAMEELSDVDVAYTRMAKETYDSKRTVLLDSDRLMTSGTRLGSANKATLIENAGLPDYVKMVEGTGTGDIYHEINPTMNTDIRIRGINMLLSQIGFKCGFSNGYFVFNERTGMVTATQVEADDRRTLQLVADVRKSLKSCLDGLIYALDRFADAYGLAPSGKYEIGYDMSDITENTEEDKIRWYSYVQSGFVPFWYYLTKFEGYTEEEAKGVAVNPMEQAAQMQGLYVQ